MNYATRWKIRTSASLGSTQKTAEGVRTPGCNRCSGTNHLYASEDAIRQSNKGKIDSPSTSSIQETMGTARLTWLRCFCIGGFRVTASTVLNARNQCDYGASNLDTVIAPGSTAQSALTEDVPEHTPVPAAPTAPSVQLVEAGRQHRR